jgi:tripartite-type tricarboxylate transporter receptor subunit TctC
MRRRTFLLSGALAAPTIVPGTLLGQGAPRDHEKDFRIIVGFEAGGGADAVARAIAVQMQRRTSRRVRVENKTGTYGALPGEIIRKGSADGVDLALLSSTTLVSRLSSKDFPYDPAKDLAPVMQAGIFSIALAVAPALPAGNFDEYLRWLRDGDEPERRRIAVSSNTTFVQVFNVLLKQAVGTTLEPVSYRGVLPILADMRDGKIPATVNTLTSLLPPHRGRRTRILMTTGKERLKVAPNIPTATELGFPRLDMEEWFAFFVAPKTPPSIVAELNDTLRRVMEDPEMVGLMSPLGLTVKTSTPEELTALIGAHRRLWQARMEYTGVALASGP